jgi:hypothetical protein
LVTVLGAAPVPVPSKVTLTFANGDPLNDERTPLRLRAADGRIFELSLGGSPDSLDLTLLRPGHRPSATNLLEPPGHWHGIEPFVFNGGDFDPGFEPTYGRIRDIPVRNYPLKLHVEVLDGPSADVTDKFGRERTVFKKLVMTAELRPAP